MATPGIQSTLPIHAASGHHANRDLAGKVDMRQRIAAFDWAATDLGPVETWSRPLRTAVQLCLGSRMCSCIYWGPNRRILYNDAYGSILGNKHPWALGRTVDEVWSEIVHVIGPLMRHTLETGETTGGDDVPIFLNRSGYVEEFYCSFSYSPIFDENGAIEGVFATLPETSIRVIGERRLRTMQQLGTESREARNPSEALKIAAEVLERNSHDIPFASLYLWRPDDSAAILHATANIAPATAWSPTRIEFGGTNEIESALRASQSAGYDIVDLQAARDPIPLGAWRVPAQKLLVMAFMPYGTTVPKAAMLAGVNPHQSLNESHLSFFRMLGDQITRSLAQAYGHEQEDERIRERARAAQEAERIRIARELHDTLLQDIQGLRYLLEAGIARLKAGETAAVGLLENALKASVHAIDEGREILSLLRSSSPAACGIGELLATLGDQITTGSGIRFNMETCEPERAVRADVWAEIYGLCREAITNAVCHSSATQITLTLAYGDPLTISISDDGSGIDPDVARFGRAKHFGLQGMRERAANVGGELQMHSSRQSGTRVVLSIAAETAYETRPNQ